MMKRAYLSTIHPAWSLSRQRANLGPHDAEYVDEFGVPARKRGDPATLKMRAELLRPTSRQAPDVIVVASPVCLAFNADDFSAVLAAAAARNATIRFADTGAEVPPHPEMQVIDQVLRQFAIAHRRRGLTRSHQEISEERRKDTLRRIEIIRPFWPLPQPPTRDLLIMAGVKPSKPMAPATAKQHLGSRPAAQRAHGIAIAGEAGRAAGRDRKKIVKEIAP